MSDAQPGGKMNLMLRLLSLFVGIVACIAGWANSVDAQIAPPPVILTPPPQYTPQPGTETPSPTPPLATPSPAPTPTPVPGATVSPYNFVYTPAPVPGATNAPSDAPLILEIDLTDKVLRAPGPLNIRVLTSVSVATVTMRALGRDLPLPKTGDGLFSADNQLPAVPFWLHGKTYQVDFIAAVPDGRNVKVTLPVTLR